jgi:hypothetical protein
MATLRLLIVIGIFLLPTSLAAETIVLIDGTRLSGKVLSMNNGVYTIDTTSLGKVRVKSSQVTSISSGNGNSGSSGSASATNEFSAIQDQTFQSLQSAISKDKDAMAVIMQLQNDPLVHAILADKEIMDAVAKGDYGALAENSKIQRLMNHQSVKSISRKYTSQ